MAPNSLASNSDGSADARYSVSSVVLAQLDWWHSGSEMHHCSAADAAGTTAESARSSSLLVAALRLGCPSFEIAWAGRSVAIAAAASLGTHLAYWHS